VTSVGANPASVTVTVTATSLSDTIGKEGELKFSDEIIIDGSGKGIPVKSMVIQRRELMRGYVRIEMTP
jgi:hypothetical protein